MENHVGRLIEIRAQSPVTPAELQNLIPQATSMVNRHKGQVVLCTDLLGARIFPQTVTDMLMAAMKYENPRVERNAFLVGEGAVFAMQIERIIREAGSPSRRTFRDQFQLMAWLDDVLNKAESARLREFLSEGVTLRRAM